MINLKMSVRKSLFDLESMNRNVWMLENICQVALCVDNVQFTNLVEDNFLYKATDNDQDELANLDDFCVKIMLDLEDTINLIRGKLTILQRLTLMALLT